MSLIWTRAAHALPGQIELLVWVAARRMPVSRPAHMGRERDMSGDANQQDPAAVYAQLTPEQREAIARQFLDGIQQSGHPAAQQFAAVQPEAVTPQQLADMHTHARTEHKGLFGLVMNHPIASVALGAFAAYEIQQHLEKK